MKNLAIALSLILASISWVAAEAQTCAPIDVDVKSITKLESIGLLNFAKNFETFRNLNLADTSLCTNEIKFKSFVSEVDFVRMERSNIYIEKGVLAELGAFSTQHQPSQEDISTNEEMTTSLLGVMTFLSYTNADKVNWYKAEAQANIFGNTKPLGDFNNKIMVKMVQAKPTMALGLGIYRAITFERVAEDKKAYKQETHATPYQIAAVLVDNEHFELARELLTIAAVNNYRLMDQTKSPEMTLEILDKMLEPK